MMILFSILFIVLVFVYSRITSCTDETNTIFIEIDDDLSNIDDFVFFLHHKLDIDKFIHSLHDIIKRNGVCINNYILLHREMMPPSGNIFNHIFTEESISYLFHGEEGVGVELNIEMKVIRFEIKLKFF